MNRLVRDDLHPGAYTGSADIGQVRHTYNEYKAEKYYNSGSHLGDIFLEQLDYSSIYDSLRDEGALSAAVLFAKKKTPVGRISDELLDRVSDFRVTNSGGKTYQTYTKTNPTTGQVYCGRTSGCGTPEQSIARRDSGHHMNQEGYGPAVLDKSSSNPAAIRGREQQVIEANGGAQSTGGTSGNAINGISPRNKKGSYYLDQARKEFGG